MRLCESDGCDGSGIICRRLVELTSDGGTPAPKLSEF